jgi:predicted  nucleic acid-binding Zn-ribbon protein
MASRWSLYKTYQLSKKREFDIEEYNSLTHEFALVSEQIDRLEDELQVN